MNQNKKVAKVHKDVPELDEKSKGFLEFAEKYNVDMNAFFIMFSVWLGIKQDQKDALLVELVKTGKVTLGEDVREDDKDK